MRRQASQTEARARGAAAGGVATAEVDPCRKIRQPCYRRYRFSRFLASGLAAASAAGVSVT